MILTFISMNCSSCGIRNYYDLKGIEADIVAEKKKSLSIIKKWHQENNRNKVIKDSLAYYKRLLNPEI
jgi:serine protease inhibitor